MAFLCPVRIRRGKKKKSEFPVSVLLLFMYLGYPLKQRGPHWNWCSSSSFFYEPVTLGATGAISIVCISLRLFTRIKCKILTSNPLGHGFDDIKPNFTSASFLITSKCQSSICPFKKKKKSLCCLHCFNSPRIIFFLIHRTHRRLFLSLCSALVPPIPCEMWNLLERS